MFWNFGRKGSFYPSDLQKCLSVSRPVLFFGFIKGNGTFTRPKTSRHYPLKTNFLFSIRTYQIVLLVLMTLLGISCYHRAIHFDEAWFAEQAYWLIQSGHVRSEIFEGYNGWEQQIYVFHKLFIYTEAALMRVLSVSLASSRVLPFVCGLGTAALIWQYCRRFSCATQWLSLLLFFGCGLLIRYFAINRPEIMYTMLGLACYLMLDREPGKPQQPALAGLFAGMAALTHLNGLIYLAAGGLWLLTRKEWRGSLIFGVVGGLTLSLYGLDALLNGEFAQLEGQFLHDPATQANFQWKEKLRVMINYQQLFFHSHREVPLTVLTLLGLLRLRNISGECEKRIVLYLGLLFIMFLLLTKGHSDFYFLLFVPWMVILVAHAATHPLVEWSKWQRRAGRLLLVGYLGGSLFVFWQELAKNRSTPYAPSYNAMLAEHMPRKHSLVIAPLSFFFGQMERYQIRGLTTYFLREKSEGKIPLTRFFAEAHQKRVEYIISDEETNASYFIPMDAPDEIGGYRRVFQDESTSIYARQR